MNQQMPGLNYNIESKGCKYLCHLKIAELLTATVMNVAELNKLYEKHKANGWLENECDVISPGKITRDFVTALGGSSDITQIGSVVDSTRTFWGGDQNRPIQYILACFKTENGTHWILMDPKYREQYDPYTKKYIRLYPVRFNLMG